MPSDDLLEALSRFTKEKRFRGRGALSVALVVTQHARKELPLNPDDLITDGGGQVYGLGKGAVQAVLAKHGIDRVLAAEGGRTSRGSIGNMREYVALLNHLHLLGLADLDAIEKYWIARVLEFFAGKPFRIRIDPSRSLRNVIRDLLAQAEERQKDSPGVYYAGTVLQHLVGATLDFAMGPGKFEHNSSTTSDAQSGRAGDFLIGDVAIHVTASPGEAVIARCRDNLNDSLRPVIVTLRRGATVAEGLAENAELSDRIDVFEAEQFFAAAIYQRGRPNHVGRGYAIGEIIKRYNEIVDEFETDPSLKIEMRT